MYVYNKTKQTTIRHFRKLARTGQVNVGGEEEEVQQRGKTYFDSLSYHRSIFARPQ